MDRILKIGGNSLFYSFSNADGKQWIMPRRNLSTAMNLYQPSYWKGKMVKTFLPLLKTFPDLLALVNIGTDRYSLDPQLEERLRGYFQVSEIEFSVFLGTPSVHQKIILQISYGEKVLGYCKVSDKAEIKIIFRHEQQILAELKEKGVKQIPECLYCGALNATIDMFVQTTVKTNFSKIIHNWNNLHWEFLISLQSKTNSLLPFEQSDFYRMLNRLHSQLDYISPKDASVVNAAIKKVQKHYKGKEVNFSAYHADFTPWNMFVEKGELFVFDFEYAKMNYPPYLDYFHFFTQTGIFTRHWDSQQLFATYQIQKSILLKQIENPDFAYLCYLLAVIGLYVNREKGNKDKGVARMFATWITLLELIQNEA